MTRLSFVSLPMIMRAKNYLNKRLNSCFIAKDIYANQSIYYSNRLKNQTLVKYITRLSSTHLNTSRCYLSLSNRSQKSILCLDESLKNVRNLSTNSDNSSKSKSLSKSNSQLKLAQILSKSTIDSFPLIKQQNFDLKDFRKENKVLFKSLKDCEKNKLNFNLYYPSVTTILNSTLSVQSLVALNKWKKMKINELGEQGFKKYQKNLFLRGSLLHRNIKNFIESKDESTLVLNESVENFWKSLSNSRVLERIHDVKLSETPVSHPFLCYKGIVDCVAYYSGKPVIIEWKTSEKLKPSLKDIYDNPLQAVAYMGAINYQTQHSLAIDEVVLVYAYEDGTNAQIHHLNADFCNRYWKQWLSRVKSYWDLIAFK